MAGAGASLSGCSALEGPDWLVAEAASPDRRLVARLWCEDFCDVPEAASLTISPASRPVAIERDNFAAAEGDMPAGDFVVRVFREVEHPPKLSWIGGSTVVIGGRCLTDGNYRPLSDLRHKAITVRIESSGPCGKADG